MTDSSNIRYYIQSKDTGIYHLVKEETVRRGGLHWTLCNLLATHFVEGPPPSGYRLCHHCGIVQERKEERATKKA